MMIQKGCNEGFVETGLCFSKETGTYLIVMTESTAVQSYNWDNQQSDFTLDGHSPSFVLHHPNNDLILTIRKTDINRNSLKTPDCWKVIKKRFVLDIQIVLHE